MAELHRDQHEAAQQEGQEQRETVGVVQSGDQHEQQQHQEAQPGPCRQDVQSPPLQRQGQGIDTLTPSNPSAIRLRR